MPGEVPNLPQRWIPRNPRLLEVPLWLVTAKEVEKINAHFAAQLGIYSDRNAGLRRSTTEIRFKTDFPIRNSSRYHRIYNFLQSNEVQIGKPILRNQGMLDLMTATSTFAWLEGSAAGMNDAYDFFLKEHLERATAYIIDIDGNKQTTPREIFNLTLKACYEALPQYILNQISVVKID